MSTFSGEDHNFYTQNQSTLLKEILLRIGYCGVGFISIAFMDYIIIFLDLPSRRIFLAINTIYGIIVAVLILKTNLIINGFNHFSWGYYPKAGILHPLFLVIFLSYCICANILMFNVYRREPKNSQKANQIKYVFLGLSIFTLACWDFIPNYGIELYTIGYIPATIFILIIFYAIIKHNLMNISVVINRSLVYSILITTITIIYLLFVLLIERLSQNIFRYNSLIVSLLSAVIIAISFIPLKDWIQKFIDRFFLKKSPFDLANENQLLRAEVIKTEKLKSISILASGMAHEIRNPLTALKTFSEYLPNRLDDKEFLQKFSKIVGSEVDRIDGLVTQLLEFAKPSPVQLTKTDLNKLIKDTLDFLGSKFVATNIQVIPELAIECDHPIMLDPSKIKQALLNIFLNAVDAMKVDGTLTIRTHADENKAIITISDTGCGIKKENLTHIFDPFFSTKDTGTGLGLPVTYGIIKEHGGDIKVESHFGRGTTFTITLPGSTSLRRAVSDEAI